VCNKIEKNEMGGHVACMGRWEVYTVFWWGKPEKKGSNPIRGKDIILLWVFCVCCHVEISATSWSLVQRSPTDCGALLCVI